MATQVDARGLSCPQPVILTTRAVAAGAFPIEVLVDNAASRDNVRRFAEKKGLAVATEDANDGFKLTLTNAG